MKFRFYGPAVLLFFVGIVYAQRLIHMKALWILTLILSLIALAYGIKQLYLGYSEAEQLWFSSISFTTLFIKGVARPFSFFQSPAAFADYMQLGIISLVILSGWKKEQPWYLFLLLVPLLFYGALITSVRSNWIGVIMTLVLWSSLLRVKGGTPRIAIIAFIAVLFIAYTMLDESFKNGFNIARVFSSGSVTQQHLNLLVTERANAITNPFEEYSFLSRLALWKYLLVLSTDPIMMILGRGVGALNADSLYFTYLAELGYPGMIFIILITFVFIRTGFRTIDRSEKPEIVAIAKGITLMNIIFAIINVTGTHVHSFPGDAYFWFWNGVLIRLAPPPTEKITGAESHADPVHA